MASTRSDDLTDQADGARGAAGAGGGLRMLKLLTVALAAWSTMIWVQRIRNIIDNRAGESFVPPVLNLVLVAAAVVAVFLAPRAVKLLAAMAFGLWSVAWWVVNQAINLPKPVPPWVPAEQAVPFKVVHAVLGIVAILLGAALAWRAWRLRAADVADATAAGDGGAVRAPAARG